MEAGKATLIVALLLLAPSALAWSQYRGGPDRTGLAPFAGGPLDVVANFSADDVDYAGFPAGAPAIVTPHGVTLLAFDRGECVLHVYADVAVPEPARLTIDSCHADANPGWLIGYDETNDHLLACIAGDVGSPHLQALDPATGDLVWGLSASAFSPAPAPAFSYWACRGGALDVVAGEIVTFFLSFGASGASADARLASVDLATGEIRWSTLIQQGAGAGLFAPPAGFAATPISPLAGPRSVSLTQTGIVVMFVEFIPNANVLNPNVASLMTFTRGGVQTGAFRSNEPTIGTSTPTPRATAASWYALGRGPLAALAFGGEAVLVNPELGTFIARGPITAADPSFNYIWWPTGAWTDEAILLPLPHSLSAFEPTTLEVRWTYSEGFDWDVREILATVNGEVHVLLGLPATGEGQIVTLDVATGTVNAKIPLPFYVPTDSDGVSALQMVPLPNGSLFVFDRNGNRTLLARAGNDLLPQLSISSLFPEVGQSFSVDIEPAAGRSLRRLEVQWGDGTVEDVPPGRSISHAYSVAGPETLRVLVVYTDGLTGTAVRALDVGGTPPPELTALQKAFSPENQEITFFLLGLMVTILGVGFTIGRQRRRFNKLERELAAVEEIRMLSVQDPRAAVLALKSYRDRLPSDLGRRRIDDSQYQVLDIRSARLLKVLRTRMFSPYDARLSTRYHRLLDAAFEDAILQPSERDALAAALDVEDALMAGERERIVAILGDFTSARPDLH